MQQTERKHAPEGNVVKLGLDGRPDGVHVHPSFHGHRAVHLAKVVLQRCDSEDINPVMTATTVFPDKRRCEAGLNGGKTAGEKGRRKKEEGKGRARKELARPIKKIRLHLLRREVG